MTLEQYDTAVGIRAEINHLADFEGVLANCKGNKLKVENYDLSVVNFVHVRDLDVGLIDKLLGIVRAEIRAKEDEFRSL